MGYIENNLISGEAVTYRGHLHWKVVFWQGVLALVLGSAGAYIIWRANSATGAQDFGPTFVWAGVVLIVIGVIPFIAAQVKRASSEFAVTNKRVIVKLGFIKRDTVELFLHKIESVSVDQSVTGRMLGYGSLALHGTGGTAETFHDIAKPLEFRRQVQEQIGKSGPGGSGAAAQGPADG